jgi:hypothetical protein
MKFVLKLRYSVKLIGLSGGSDWVTIARVSQGPANNVSVVLGLRSYVAYDCIPRFVLG